MQENKNNAANDVKEGGIGRTHGIAEGHQEEQNNKNTRDISEIGQQEGNMNHGTLGGNFDTSGSDAASEGNSNR